MSTAALRPGDATLGHVFGPALTKNGYEKGAVSLAQSQNGQLAAKVEPSSKASNGRLGDRLIHAGLITKAQLDKGLEEQKRTGGLIGSNLIKLGFISEEDLLHFLSKQFGFPAVDVTKVEIPADLLKLVPSEVVQKHSILPVSRAGSTLVIATSDPTNYLVIDDIKFLTGYNIDVVVAEETALKEAINRYYDQSATLMDVMSDLQDFELEVVDDEEELNIDELEKSTSEAPVVKLVNVILTEAIAKEASDIHIEPYEKQFRVRYRIDGVLHEIMNPPMRLRNAILSRMKIMSHLDIAERRLPQDGRIKLKTVTKEMDFRVSVLPTLFGEKIVLRLLDKSALQLDMTKLGFEAQALKDFQEAIYQPYGMVLVTGPTGSGKTTSLYSALTELNKVTQNISTAEDPVEYNLPGINQVQMHEEIGLNFAAALRAFLRQDPDIIMVGEVRDFETAEIAIKAALTGHLVLSTLHTNDAPSTIHRMLNMGVEPFLVSSSVNLILAQRLVRKICSECKETQELNPQALVEMGMSLEEAESTQGHKGAGCERCSDTGYKGRIALYEVMPLGEDLKELILEGGSSGELKRAAREAGMKTLRESGLHKIREGITTAEEVMRVTTADDEGNGRSAQKLDPDTDHTVPE
jgi:type IV pilus assembly protein PilB